MWHVVLYVKCNNHTLVERRPDQRTHLAFIDYKVHDPSRRNGSMAARPGGRSWRQIVTRNEWELCIHTPRHLPAIYFNTFLPGCLYDFVLKSESKIRRFSRQLQFKDYFFFSCDIPVVYLITVYKVDIS
jgi:hypothetical protein